MLSTPVSKNKTPAMYLSAPPPGVPQCLENSEFQDAEKGSLQNLEAETTWLVSSEAAKPLWARCPGWWAPGCREWVLAAPEGSVTEVGGSEHAVSQRPGFLVFLCPLPQWHCPFL